MALCRCFKACGTCRIVILVVVLCIMAASSWMAVASENCLTCRCVADILAARARLRSDKTADISANREEHHVPCAWERLGTGSREKLTSEFPVALRKAFKGEAEGLEKNWPAIRDAWQRELQTMTAACGYRFDSGSLAGLPVLVRRCIEDQALTRILARAWRERLKAAAETSEGKPASQRTATNPCQAAWGACVATMNVQRVENAAALMAFMEGAELAKTLQNEPRLAGSIFLITQHADSLPSFQAAMLGELTALSKRGLLPAREVAMLTDRVMAKIRGKQHFGTQMSCAEGKVVYRPPLDAAREVVDQRRQEVGLPTLDRMEQMMAERFCAQHRP